MSLLRADNHWFAVLASDNSGHSFTVLGFDKKAKSGWNWNLFS